MFDNLFENMNFGANYVIIGLIVLTLVCIYLLYTTLTSGSHTNDLKRNINDLIAQNKKRDEIIHFLVGQVQMLQSEPPISEITTTTATHPIINEEFVNLTHNEMVGMDVNDIVGTASQQEQGISIINNDDMKKLDELLSEPVSAATPEETPTVSAATPEEETPAVSAAAPEEETSTAEQVLNSSTTSNTLPKKDMGMLGIYNLSELKAYAKQLNISTSGSKKTLVKRIYDAL